MPEESNPPTFSDSEMQPLIDRIGILFGLNYPEKVLTQQLRVVLRRAYRLGRHFENPDLPMGEFSTAPITHATGTNEAIEPAPKPKAKPKAKSRRIDGPVIEHVGAGVRKRRKS